MPLVSIIKDINILIDSRLLDVYGLYFYLCSLLGKNYTSSHSIIRVPLALVEWIWSDCLTQNWSMRI